MKFLFKKFKVSLLYILFLIIILSIAGFFITRQYTKANVDYICTETVALDGQCIVPPDGWGPWSIIIQPTATLDGQTKRTGSGTKEVSLTRTYHSRRTSCGAGTTVVGVGNSGGATGWYGANTNVVYSACQIDQFGVIPKTPVSFPPICTLPQVMGYDGNCINPPLPDLCYNIVGIQNPVPAGMNQDEFYNCIPINTNDMCGNLSGIQTVVPTGWQLVLPNNCVPWNPNITTVPVSVDFQCSSNKTLWTDCSRIVLPTKDQPIWLKPSSNLTGPNKAWHIENNDTEPLSAGESKGVFSNNTNTITTNIDPYIKLTFGEGNSFTKRIELSYTGTATGEITNGIGLMVKDLNIRISLEGKIEEE